MQVPAAINEANPTIRASNDTYLEPSGWCLVLLRPCCASQAVLHALC